jgi:hypothetical protein
MSNASIAVISTDGVKTDVLLQKHVALEVLNSTSQKMECEVCCSE